MIIQRKLQFLLVLVGAIFSGNTSAQERSIVGLSQAQRGERAGQPWRTLMARKKRDRQEGDELHGMIFIHGGDHSDFVARRGKEKKATKRK